MVYFCGGPRDIYRHASDDEFKGEALDLLAAVRSMLRSQGGANRSLRACLQVLLQVGFIKHVVVRYMLRVGIMT